MAKNMAQSLGWRMVVPIPLAGICPWKLRCECGVIGIACPFLLGKFSPVSTDYTASFSEGHSTLISINYSRNRLGILLWPSSF
jgi:hypothetical protein